MKRNLGRALMLAAVGMVAIGARASADTAYTIDPTQSYVTGAIWFGSPLADGSLQVTGPQVGPGGQGSSDTSNLNGTLNADVTGTSISFGGGSTIGLTLFPGVLLPDADGGTSASPDPTGDGGSPAQIGLSLTITEGYAAINGATLDVTGAATPIAGGSFDATQQGVTLLTASLAYWISGLANGSDVVGPPGLSATNGIDSSGNSTYQTGTVSGNTITLPLFVDVQEAVSGLTIDVVFTGQIVATAGAVPETSTFVLGGLGLVGSVLAYRVRRKLRNA